MKFLNKLIWMGLFTLGLSALNQTPSAALQDAIVAVVNDEVITLKDLKDYIHQTYVSLVAEGVSNKEIQEIMTELEINGINKLIEDKLILSKAKEIGLEVREKIVDERVQEIKMKYETEQNFINSLVNHGATVTDLRNKIKDQLMIQFVIEHEVKSKIYVNPHEVTKYYEKNIEKFQKKEQAILDSIYVAFKNDKQSALKKAKEAFNKIEAGEDFKSVADTHSEAPSIGKVEKGQLMPAVEEKIFTLKEGGHSALVEVENGVYIFKLREKIPSQTASLQEVKSHIYNYIFQKKLKDRFTAWLDKLKKNAYINIKS